MCYRYLALLLAALPAVEGAALRLRSNRDGAKNGKASFEYVGQLVPHVKTIEVALTYDFIAAENATRTTYHGLEDQVAAFKDKFPHSLDEHRELDRLMGDGQRELNHHLGRLEKLTRQEGIDKRAWYDTLGVVVTAIQGWSNSRHVSTLAGNDHIIHREVEINRGLLAEASNQTKALKRLALEALEYEHLSSTVATVIEKLTLDVKERIEAVYSAAQGILHPLFGPEELIEEALDRARKIGRNESLVPVFDTAISLLRAPVSLVMGSHAAGVLFHVPLHDEITEPMKLFHLESAQVVREFEVERIDTDKTYLAEDTRGWRVTLSDGELLKCRRSGVIYLCDSHRELHRGTFDCLSSLFDGSSETKWCSSKVVPHNEDYVVGIGGNLYFGRVEDATLHCLDGSSKSMSWDNLSFKTVHNGCWVSTPNYLVLVDHRQTRTKGKSVSIQAPTGTGNFNDLPGPLDAGYKRLDDFHAGWNTTHVQKIQELDYTTEYLLYGIVGVVALVVVLFLGLVFLMKYLTRNKTAAVIATGAAGLATGNPLLMESAAAALLAHHLPQPHQEPEGEGGVGAGVEEDAAEEEPQNESGGSLQVNVSSGGDSGVSSHDTTREDHNKNMVDTAARVAKACLAAHQALRPSQPLPEEYNARRSTTRGRTSPPRPRTAGRGRSPASTGPGKLSFHLSSP